MFVSFLNTNAQNPVQEFNFNGNFNNTDNTISFLGSPNYVNDRMGAVRGAQRLQNKSLQGVIGDLPQDNKPRTISIWIKFNAVNAINNIFGYGSAANAQFFGLVQQAVSSGSSDVGMVGWGDTNNVIAAVPLAKDVWYQYSITYDGTVSKIYRNGELLKSAEGITRSTKGYIFKLGQINTAAGINADIDDLKIYNVAMTEEQVMESYNSSKPAGVKSVTENVPASSTVKKAVTTPVKTAIPAKATVSVTSTTSDSNNGPKIIEVFSQGRKLTRSNASNIGDLPEGTYLLKVTNPSRK